MTEWRWAAPDVNTIVLLRPRGDRGRARLARAPPTDRLRLRRPRAHVRRWRQRRSAGSSWFALACMVFVPGRDRPQAREQEAGRAAPRAEPRDRHRAHRRAPGRRRLALRPRRVVVRGVLAPRGRSRRCATSSARRPRLRVRSLLRLDALQDPGAPRPRRVRRALRALRPRVLRSAPGLRLRGRPDWKSFADGYRIVIVDETRSVAHGGLPRGARCARRSTATTRSRSSPARARSPPRARTPRRRARERGRP